MRKKSKSPQAALRPKAPATPAAGAAGGLKRFIYDSCLHLLLVAFSPYFLFKMLYSGKYRRGLKERFGFIPREKLEKLTGNGRRVVWFHAVSVGETKAVMPLLKLYREKHPDVKIVFSTVTPTGQDEAARTGKGTSSRAAGAALIDVLIYFPLDLGWIVERVFALVRPDALVIVEKEYWPNIITRAARRGVPVAVVNGTMSDRSFNNYKRAGFIFGGVFSSLALFSARTERDKEKALSLGVAPERVVKAGNMKFDFFGLDGADAGARAIAKRLGADIGISAGDTVIVAGSTHAGEEDALVEAYKNLAGEFENLKLVIAPRHPERFNEVAAMMEKKGVAFCRRSDEKARKSSDVVLLDTMGELRAAYALSTVAFVGGTLAPIGGHNLFEPAAFEKPVVFGPSVESCPEMARLLVESEAGIQVLDRGGLEGALKRLLADDALRKKMGLNARRELERNSGACEKTLKLLDSVITFDKKRC